MNRKQLIIKVSKKLEERKILGFNFLNLIKKFVKIPSKEEAIKILKDINKEDIQKAYSYLPQIKKEVTTSFNFESIKKYIIILAALAVIAGGSLPASASEANQVCQENCQVKESPFKGYSFKQDVPIKFFKSIKDPKDLNDIKNQALKEMKPVFLENGIKVPSIDKIKLFNQENKEIKDMKDYYKTLSNSMSFDSILMVGN